MIYFLLQSGTVAAEMCAKEETCSDALHAFESSEVAQLRFMRRAEHISKDSYNSQKLSLTRKLLRLCFFSIKVSRT